MNEIKRNLHSAGRQYNNKTRSRAVGILNFDSAVVGQNNFLHQWQAQAGALRFCGEEGNENLGKNVRRDTMPIIFDYDPNMIAVLSGMNGNANCAFSIKSLDCIDQKIEKRLPDESRIAGNNRAAGSAQPDVVGAWPRVPDIGYGFLE